MIFFNGQSSDALGVIVEHYPTRMLPARKAESVAIPGRNGSLTLDQGAFENYTKTYDVYLSAEAKRLPKVAAEAASWLLSASGFKRLEDTYEPDVYRMGRFVAPMDIENIFNRFGRAKLKFDCWPQRFLKAGENPVAIPASGASITNPTAFEALPLVTISGNGSGTVTINGVAVTINAIGDSITLDCETQNAYSGMANRNNQIYAPAFPVLQPGKNIVSWTGGVTAVTLVPRWWTI